MKIKHSVMMITLPLDKTARCAMRAQYRNGRASGLSVDEARNDTRRTAFYCTVVGHPGSVVELRGAQVLDAERARRQARMAAIMGEPTS